MQTIKTLVVVVLLLAVCYGAFVALTTPEVGIPEELRAWAEASGNEGLDDFEIPSISLNQPYAPRLSESPPQFADFSDPATLPQFPSTEASEPNSDHFRRAAPAVSAIAPGSPAEPHAAETRQDTPGSAAQPSDGWSNLPELPVAADWPVAPGQHTPATDPSGRGQAPSSALLTSTLPATGDALGSDPQAAPGPSVPFNPFDLSAADNLSGSDLISAVDSLSSPPLADAGQGGVVGEDKSTTGGHQVPAHMTSSGIGGGAAKTAEVEDLKPFAEARQQALAKAQQGNLSEALEMMSQYYEHPELDYAEHTDLVDLLDALSREVIYSNRSLLGPPHTVTPQDTLKGLAEKHRVTPELLAAINGMGDSQALVPATQIKVLTGPFHATVNLSRGELTLFLRKMYAGRFPVAISKTNQPNPGTYEVVDRRRDRTFYGADVVIPAGAPTNPYGGYWLSLGGNLSIHGSPEQVTSDLEGAGCISLAPLDAADAYRILGKGSSVEIRP